VKFVTLQLQTQLTRQSWSALYDVTIDTALASESSKLGLLARRLQHPGPPLHITIDRISLPSHRAAFASFLCADWFFGKFAKNYFAKNLLPKTRAHSLATADAGVANEMVCLACWHFRRRAFLEDEFHVICVCPSYHRARQAFLNRVPNGSALNTQSDLSGLLSQGDPACLNALGQFLLSVRQTRRKLKVDLERFNDRVCTRSFSCKRVAWRLKGKHCCRHGVLFRHPPVDGCKCLSQNSLDDDWSHAVFMPALDHDIKCIVAVPFNRVIFKRLGVLQAEARHLQW
jgi:hypothetical protein